MSKDRRFSTAIHIMTVLAYGEPDLITSESIALGLRTNPGLVRRVLLKLSEMGLVTSRKGKGGGNRLAKPIHKINLEEIYLAVKEGPLFGSFDKEPYEECPISRSMGNVLTSLHADLERSLLEEMRSITLEEILDQTAGQLL